MADDEKDLKPTTTTGKSGAKIATSPLKSPDKKSPSAGKKAASRVVDEEDDDDFDDDDDDDDDDDELEEEELPRRRASARGRGASRPVARAVAARRVEVAPRRRVVRQPPQYYVPFAIGGMMLVGAHVFFDVAYAPVAVLGISLCIWAYMGIGSANEISRLAGPGRAARAPRSPPARGIEREHDRATRPGLPRGGLDG